MKCDGSIDYSLMKCDKQVLVMYRTAIEQLIEWKDSWCRKPLIVEGARQVGKTWLVKVTLIQQFTESHRLEAEIMK